ncbi:MAG: dicarboxylate/amino acid:cation symporter [Candidatus Peregrinibacteria bacterium]|nr:dicarboxylate/amino acid:cation symporter [Candidatus Peregrinibacteria bacterium]MCB9808263.1 dicarboxylate/amino acid:cation symporter [Candidatus Peribacteria bacterium]
MLFVDGKRSIGALAHTLERHIHGRLWLQVLVGMACGTAIGIALGPDLKLIDPQLSKILAEWLALPGELFLRLIKMVLIPLVFFSIIRGLGGANLKQLKNIGPRFLIYLLCTTALSCIIGIGLASVLHPGSYVHIEQSVIPHTGALNVIAKGNIVGRLPETFINILPENPLSSAIDGEMFGTVVFSLLLGLAFAMQPTRTIKHLLSIIDDLLNIFMTIVKWAMHLAPLAVFGLTARMAAETGLSVLLGMSMYILTVLLGLMLVMMMYHLLIMMFTKRRPLEFASSVTGVQLLAFSTSSSAAVMPVSIKTAEENLGIDPSISEVIIPLGTTINMDGTAIYQSIAIIFMAQSAGMALTLAQMVLIVITLIASSIGSPGTPGVGVAILMTVASNLGIPTGAHGLILGVDRLLDMCRTAVNVTGDLTACVIFGTKK